MDQSKERSCDGKAGWSTREKAMTALLKHVRLGATRIGVMKQYRCRYCRLWHIGHQDWATQQASHKIAETCDPK